MRRQRRALASGSRPLGVAGAACACQPPGHHLPSGIRCPAAPAPPLPPEGGGGGTQGGGGGTQGGAVAGRPQRLRARRGGDTGSKGTAGGEAAAHHRVRG
uniref:Uncharacterized protein n=1 Tax=Oryza sativa subsp. japonica TaxID=39947 RepID=Q69LE2_ORYSJ|nr:hypothetical protein [Oryza sativa Japonica Group]